jgi:hypothetical protein
MTQATTAKHEEEEGSGKRIIVLEIVGVFFFLLSLASSIVIMLLPLQGLLRGAFPGNPARALWLLFTICLVFGVVLDTLGATKLTRVIFSKFAGGVDLIQGFLCAVEIFLLKAYGVPTSSTSLWWLFIVLTVLGTACLYLPVRAKRLKEAEEKRKADEALAKKQRTSPTIVRLKNRRYYVCEQKMLVCKD